MKRIYLLLTVLGLVFFVSSCKNTMDVTKRRYTKGYHFDKHKGPSTPQEGLAQQKSKAPVSVIEPVAQTLPTSKTPEQQIKGGLKENNAMNGFAEKTTKKQAAPVAEEKKATEKTHVKNKPLKQGSRIQQKSTKSTSGAMSEDVKLILLIILALFIPPLAMYLWDKQTDVWFIIDLVLFLLLFTWFFFPFGLIGLTAIVIAILRILEAI